MHELAVLFFAVAIGITLSGLVSSVYRLTGWSPKSMAGKILEAAVLVFGGPVIFIGSATRSFKKKHYSRAAYALAIALCGFWSFAMGVFILAVYVNLRA